MPSLHQLCESEAVKCAVHKSTQWNWGWFSAAPAKKQKLTVKGGGVVDPDSGLERTHHVYQHRGRAYNAVLGMVDIKRGANTYYKMQVLEADKVKR